MNLFLQKLLYLILMLFIISLISFIAINLAPNSFFASGEMVKDEIIKRLPTIITLLGLSLPGIIGGSVILESIFGIDGMGLLFYQSALSHDYPVIMGILIIGSFLTLVGNVLAGLVLIKLNPSFKSI